MPPAKLLIIDDEPNVLYSLRKGLSSPSLHVLTAATAASGLELFETERPDAVLLDLRLRDASGLDALQEIRRRDADAPVIMFTAYSTTATAIEATRQGAFEYLPKPVDLKRLREAVDRALSARRQQSKAIAEASEEHLAGPTASAHRDDPVHLVGMSPAMQSVYKLIGRYAGSPATVLVQGESGTGKDLVAAALHRYSDRSHKPFVAINCAALHETLLESELFGHERGAFTGADKRRIGKFEHADGGTIFLDEIGDMSPATQAKVLRLLQNQSFERLGGNETIRANVRVVAATNRDLQRLVADGAFRADLYYRLNVFAISLPALRERLSDIPDLARHFLHAFVAETARRPVALAPDTLERLTSYTWPGNMRELQSVLRHALAHATGSVVTVDCLPRAVQEHAATGRLGDGTGTTTALEATVRDLLAQAPGDAYRQIITHVDRIVLREALARHQGNVQRAADALGISRNTLKAKLRMAGAGSNADHLGQLLTTDS